MICNTSIPCGIQVDNYFVVFYGRRGTTATPRPSSGRRTRTMTRTPAALYATRRYELDVTSVPLARGAKRPVRRSPGARRDVTCAARRTPPGRDLGVVDDAIAGTDAGTRASRLSAIADHSDMETAHPVHTANGTHCRVGGTSLHAGTCAQCLPLPALCAPGVVPALHRSQAVRSARG